MHLKAAVQSHHQAQIAPIEFRRGRYKVHPLSIGDWHTTHSLAEVESMEELRFFGLKRECGLHEG